MRRRLILPFLSIFVPMLMLFVGGLVVVILLAYNDDSHGMMWGKMLGRGRPPFAFMCIFPGMVIASAMVVGAWSYRRVGKPVAEIMTAADAVANGDLNVRLALPNHGPFVGLVNSFNRMTQELARNEQQRRNLTADVAHELRTPLHIIQGNLEGILDGVYEASPEHLTATLDETRLLARLVNDLQTLSLAESGQLPLYFSEVSAMDLLSDAYTSFAGQAGEQKIQLTLDVPTQASGWLMKLDADRIGQVLNNLVSNALRHTAPGGEIQLRAHQREGMVLLQVQDNGAGIAAEDLPFVFDRFWRADRARQRNAQNSSGLGLAIARQLVQAHAGAIRVESEVGRGTLFEVQLPLAGA